MKDLRASKYRRRRKAPGMHSHGALLLIATQAKILGVKTEDLVDCLEGTVEDWLLLERYLIAAKTHDQHRRLVDFVQISDGKPCSKSQTKGPNK